MIVLATDQCEGIQRNYTGYYDVVEGTCTTAYSIQVSIGVSPPMEATLISNGECSFTLTNYCSIYNISWEDDLGNTGNTDTYNAEDYASEAITFTLTNPTAPDGCNSMTYTENFVCITCTDVGFLPVDEAVAICSNQNIDLYDYLNAPEGTVASWTTGAGDPVANPNNINWENNQCVNIYRNYIASFDLGEGVCATSHTQKVMLTIYPAINATVLANDCSIELVDYCDNFDLSWEDSYGFSSNSAWYGAADNTSGTVSFTLSNPNAPVECSVQTFTGSFACNLCNEATMAEEKIEVNICSEQPIDLNSYVNLPIGTSVDWIQANGNSINDPSDIVWENNQCANIYRNYVGTYSLIEGNCTTNYSQKVEFTIYPAINANIVANDCSVELLDYCDNYDLSWEDSNGFSSNSSWYGAVENTSGTVTFTLTNSNAPNGCNSESFTADFNCIPCELSTFLDTEYYQVCSNQDVDLNDYLQLPAATDVMWFNAAGNIVNNPSSMSWSTNKCEGIHRKFTAIYNLTENDCSTDYTASIQFKILPAITATLVNNDCTVELVDYCENFEINWADDLGNTGTSNVYTPEENTGGLLTFTLSNPDGITACESQTYEVEYACITCEDVSLEESNAVDMCSGESINLNDYASTDYTALEWVDSDGNAIANPNNVSLETTECNGEIFSFQGVYHHSNQFCTTTYSIILYVEVWPSITAHIDVGMCNVGIADFCPNFVATWDNGSETGEGAAYQVAPGEEGTVIFTLSNLNAPTGCNSEEYELPYACECEEEMVTSNLSTSICSGEAINFYEWAGISTDINVYWQSEGGMPISNPNSLTLNNNSCQNKTYNFEGSYTLQDGNCLVDYMVYASIEVYPTILATINNGACAVMLETTCDNFEITWDDGNTTGNGNLYELGEAGSTGSVIFTINNPNAMGGCSSSIAVANFDCPLVEEPTEPMVDIRLTKEIDEPQDAYYVGDLISYVINVINDGPDLATGVVISEILPEGLGYAGHIESIGNYNASTGMWSIGSLQPNNSHSLVIYTELTQTGSITNTAEVYTTIEEDEDSTPDNQVESEDDQDSVTIEVSEEEQCETIDCGTESISCIEHYQAILICPDFCDINSVYQIQEASSSEDGLILLQNDCFLYEAGAAGFDSGSENIYVLAEDVYGNCASIEVVVDLAECNEDPVAENDLYDVAVDGAFTFDPTGNDTDDGALALCGEIAQPENGSITVDGNEITYTPNDGFIGIDFVNYTVCDAAGREANAVIYLNVMAPIDCEMETIETCASVYEDVTICLDFCTPDMILEEVEPSFICSINIINQRCFTYRAYPVYEGVDEVLVKGCNYFGECETTTVYIEVNDDCNNGGRYFNGNLADVLTIDDCQINIPNVFTPNRDGVNDAITISALANCYRQFEMEFMVFDALGRDIYRNRETDYQGMLWAPEDYIPEGTYFYTLRITDQETTKDFAGFIELRR